jgi:hypothetical protein
VDWLSKPHQSESVSKRFPLFAGDTSLLEEALEKRLADVSSMRIWYGNLGYSSKHILMVPTREWAVKS